MLRQFQELPVQLRFVIPLVFLGKFLTHEEQLFARMRHHVSQKSTVRSEAFRIVLPVHLLEHGAFSVDDFIVGDGENIVFGEAVEEGERELIVIERPIDGVQRDVAEHVVHPAHVPLEVEAESADVGGLGDQRPCGGFLCDHENIRIAGERCLVEVAQEFHCLQILVAAVDVGTPFAVGTVVVQIEHGCHRIHTQTVHMELLQPAAGAGDQERADLALAVVKDTGAPAFVLHF